MDKKQSLTPELKQIYERVMNTPVPASQPAQTPKPAAASVSSFSMPSSDSAKIKTFPAEKNPAPAVPPAATPHPAMPPASSVPSASSGAKTFVFSATPAPAAAGASPQLPNANTTVVMPKKGGIPVKMMVFAGITFFVFYAVFWLKVLKYF